MKSTSGRLAQSDTTLLARTDTKTTHVVVKLDYDAMASYRGDIAGLPATSPSVTGRKLTGHSAAEKKYEGHISAMDKAFRSALKAKLPKAKAGDSLTTVFGGVAVTLPANEAKSLLSLPGVAAVQEDTLNKPLQVSTGDDKGSRGGGTTALQEDAQFIGAPTLWKQLGGQDLAGRGVIFADIDTGIWPEHPMLANNPALGTPPPAPSGQPRACDYGTNPLTGVPFQCNDKVIGGRAFLDTYNAATGGEVYPTTARDSGGHGTHTTTTAAGNAVQHAPIFGVDQGPVSGVAPGAWVIEYKVCGVQGCYGSDSVNAIEQAIMDGANVINYSISGGSNPYQDPVELAFLDAYNAGIFVAASAGNSGPGAGTTDHHSPWVTTVAASTMARAFSTTLTVTSGADSATFEGTSLTPGVTTPAPIVMAESIPGYTGGALCLTPVPAGAVAGKVVACMRGSNARVEKGYNVLQGGAAGMILYNPTLADTESDNHFLPAVHLADGTAFVAFMKAHPDSMASWPAGSKKPAQGDVMAAFSSRGPGGQFLKPDITAPGVQVLAGNTPTPDELPSGPPGEYYQAIAGTSMSSPGIAGSAILVKAAHMTWSPGAIKSALMTTATTKVVKEDEKTPATPFDDGAGRVDLTQAGSAPIVFDESALNMYTKGQSPVTAVDLNLPSVNLPIMPGTVTVTRTATNVSGRDYEFRVRTTAPKGSTITVSPREGVIRKGRSQTFRITVTSTAPSGQYFGSVQILGSDRTPALHLPVAWVNTQGPVTVTQSCDPASLSRRGTTTCTVTAENTAPTAAAVDMSSSVSTGLTIVSADGATLDKRHGTVSVGPVSLAAPKDAIPAINPSAGTPGGPSPGFFDLAQLGVAPKAIGDEDALNYNVAFTFGGRSYSSIGIVSNGYAVINGAHSQADIAYTPQHLPDSAAPNGVLAPFWTDLGPGEIYAATLSDGVNSWFVAQWDSPVFGTTDMRQMQLWVGVDGTEDITYGYAPGTIGQSGSPDGLTVGAENVSGTAGAQISGPPVSSYVITTTPGEPGGKLTYSFTARAQRPGNELVTTRMRTDVTAGTTIVQTPVKVTR